MSENKYTSFLFKLFLHYLNKKKQKKNDTLANAAKKTNNLDRWQTQMNI